MVTIKATSLQRKVRKPHESWQTTQQQKTGGVAEGGSDQKSPRQMLTGERHGVRPPYSITNVASLSTFTWSGG